MAGQAGSLPFTTRILVGRFLFLPFHDGVVTEAVPAVLVGDADVIDRLLDLGCILLVVRIEQLKALAEEYPETAAAQARQFLTEIARYRAGRSQTR